MAAKKITSFSKEDQEIALVFKALSHPARVAILKYLAEQNSCMCGDIVEKLPLAQSTVSQHLKELKNAGLIKGNIDGPKICYCIDLDKYQDLHFKMQAYMNNINELNKENCC